MGTNAKKSHPLQAKFTCRPFLNAWRHAEIHSISLCRVNELEGADIYVGRALADNSWANSRPCNGCLEALKHFGIKGMYYFGDGQYLYEEVNGD